MRWSVSRFGASVLIPLFVLGVSDGRSANLYDMVQMSVSGAPGTGMITLGSALSSGQGYISFATAGVADGEVISYHVQDGANWENDRGAYHVSGTSLTRGLVDSSTGSLINLSSSAIVYIAVLASDVVTPFYRNVNLLAQYAQPPCPLVDAPTILSNAMTCSSDPTKGVGTNAITLTGSGHMLGIPSNLPAAGGQDIMFWITHSGSDGPLLASGFEMPGGPQPPECSVTVTAGCWSTAVGSTDWLPCKSIDASHLGCGSVLTRMSVVDWTFDATRITSGETLSNGNLTATITGASGNAYSVFGTLFHSASIYVYEVTAGASGANRIGASDSVLAGNAFLGADTHSFSWDAVGHLFVNGVAISSSMPTWGAGAVLDLAVDMTNQLAWGRVNGGNWNGVSSASPGGTGGVSIAGLASYTLSPAVGGFNNADAATIDASPTRVSGALPW